MGIEYPKVRQLQQVRDEKDPDLSTRYLPSSGSEGETFSANVCEKCDRYRNLEPDIWGCTLGIDMAAWAATPGDRRTWPEAWRHMPGEFPSCREWVRRTAGADAKYDEPPVLCGGTRSPERERELYLKAMRGE